ncbi:MAG: nitroreductase family protein [Peptococcaceae bacterium]|jgi:nitroreductase|nr:nitroreductase family protein [Peptococcaceae bacterium]
MDLQQTKDTFMEVVGARRSVRHYIPDKVSEEDLRMIMESARQAPSGENAQPWRFIIVKATENKEFLSKVSKMGSGRRFTGEYLSKQMQARMVEQDRLRYADKAAQEEDEAKQQAAYKKLTSGEVSAFVKDPDVVVIVIGKKEVWDLPFDTSAAIENMLLTVTALNLGACWVIAPCIDVRDELKLKEYFKIPEEYKAISIISIGATSRMPRPRPRLPLEEIVFTEKFGDAYYKQS